MLEKIAQSLCLDDQESEILLRWTQEKSSSSCLELFKVFKAHNKAREAKELLSWSLIFQPSSISVLINIAKEFLELGQVSEAWSCLLKRLNEVRLNPQGLNPYFICALALGKQDHVATALQDLEKEANYDALSLKILKNYKQFGFEASRRSLFQYFEERRTPLSFAGSQPLKSLDAFLPKLANISGKKGLCSLNTMALSKETEELTDEVANVYLWKKLDKLEQKLELLKHLKSQVRRK